MFPSLVIGGLAFWLCASVPLQAETPVEPSTAIEITAQNGIEWRRDEATINAFEAVKVIYGNLVVTSDRLIVHYTENDLGGIEIVHIEAVGTVDVVRDNLTASGEKARYEPGADLFIIDGAPATLQQLASETEPPMLLRGHRLTYMADEITAITEAAAEYGDWIVTADKITVALDESQSAHRITAADQVRATSGPTTVESNTAVYEIPTQMATFHGEVVLSQDGGTVYGEQGSLNTATNVGRLDGPVRAMIRPNAVE